MGISIDIRVSIYNFIILLGMSDSQERGGVFFFLGGGKKFYFYYLYLLD